MTKNRKDAQLRQLVQSLENGEKKQVRLNLQKNRPQAQHKLLLMFDLCSKTKASEAEAGEAQVYENMGYSSAYLAADRNELYNFVLDALADFSAEKVGELQVYRGLGRLVVLFEKKLLEQALKQAQKVKKIAQLYELFGACIEILKYEQRLYKVLGQQQAALQALAEQNLAWQEQAAINILAELHLRSIALRIQLAKARESAQINDFEALMQNPILQPTAKVRHFYSEFHRLEVYCNYFFVQDEPEQELASNEALLALFEAFPHFKKEQPLNYLVVNTRILAIRRRLFPQQFLASLAQYRALSEAMPKQNRQAESMIFIFSYNYELDTYLQQKQWANALDLLPSMQAQLKKYESEVGQEFKMTCYYRFAYTYFFSGKYLEALDFLQLVLTEFSPSLRPDVYHIALIFNIIVHYELGHVKLVLHLLQTTKYSLKKEGTLYKTERVVLRYLLRLAQLRSQKAVAQVFARLQVELVALFADAYENRVRAIFDFLDWVQPRVVAILPQNGLK